MGTRAGTNHSAPGPVTHTRARHPTPARGGQHPGGRALAADQGWSSDVVGVDVDVVPVVGGVPAPIGHLAPPLLVAGDTPDLAVKDDVIDVELFGIGPEVA